MGPIGVQEMFGIFLIALLLFGPKKLPELGRLLGKGLSEFRRAKSELKTTFDTHMRELEREAQLAEQSDRAKKALTAANANPAPVVYTPAPAQSLHERLASEAAAQDYSSVHYPYPYEDSVHSPASEPLAAVSPPAAAPAPEPLPVTGTVARANGVQAVTVQVPAVAEEERPA